VIVVIEPSMGHVSQSYGASPAIWNHTVLLLACMPPDTGERAPP